LNLFWREIGEDDSPFSMLRVIQQVHPPIGVYQRSALLGASDASVRTPAAQPLMQAALPPSCALSVEFPFPSPSTQRHPKNKQAKKTSRLEDSKKRHPLKVLSKKSA
jgi:hypothetical protein